MGVKNFLFGKESDQSRRATQLSNSLQNTQSDLFSLGQGDIAQQMGTTAETANFAGQRLGRDIAGQQFQSGLGAFRDQQRFLTRGIDQGVARRGLGNTSVGLGAQATALQPLMQQRQQFIAQQPLQSTLLARQFGQESEAQRQNRINQGLATVQSGIPLANLPGIKLGRQGGLLKNPLFKGAVAGGLTALTGGIGSGLLAGASLGGIGQGIGGSIRSGIGGLFSSAAKPITLGASSMADPFSRQTG